MTWMHPVAPSLVVRPWLVWACLLLGAPVAAGAARSVTADTTRGGQRAHVVVPGTLGDTTRATLAPVTRHIDDGPANAADTVDPASPAPLALAPISPIRALAQSSVRVSCAVAVLFSFRLLGPVGSRPPPSSF